MNGAVDGLDAALEELSTLRKVISKSAQPQVKAYEERSLAKATALAWFNTHRTAVMSAVDVAAPDTLYKEILACSGKAASRPKYHTLAKTLRKILLQLQADAVSVQPQQQAQSSDLPPDFAPLISDAGMQQILSGRWTECVACIHAGAPLAATVMMGGLLEALLLARINSESDKAPVFKATTAPKDKTGAIRPLKEWMLKSYIEVAHELKWISVSAKSVGEVLRDYRNYVHPYKQYAQSVHLQAEDAELLWEISKNIARQVIKS